MDCSEPLSGKIDGGKVKTRLILVIGAACIGVASTNFAFGANTASDSSPFELKNKKDGERIYQGLVTLEGEYFVDESGTLFFSPNKRYMKNLPEFSRNSAIGFSNQAVAIDELGLRKILTKMDLAENCGLHGKAVISISGMTVGDGPSSKWYTTAYVKVKSTSKPLLAACKH
jgi:hypothetical protein